MKRLANEEMMKILKMQNYPFEQEYNLKLIAMEARTRGWPCALIKAYQLGVIIGKREERERRI